MQPVFLFIDCSENLFHDPDQADNYQYMYNSYNHSIVIATQLHHSLLNYV